MTPEQELEFNAKLAASLKPAMDYLDEVILGHERYLKQQAEQKEKQKISEIQRLSGTSNNQ